jgi:hypothetical protein
MREEDCDEALATRAVILIEAPRDRAVEIEHREHAALSRRGTTAPEALGRSLLRRRGVEASTDRRA